MLIIATEGVFFTIAKKIIFFNKNQVSFHNNTFSFADQTVKFHGSACVFVAAVTFFSDPLPSNDRGIHIQTHRLMGRIYEVRLRDGLRCHKTHTKLHKDWLRHSKLNRVGVYTDTQIAW
jgi:hypothetical protein